MVNIAEKRRSIGRFGLKLLHSVYRRKWIPFTLLPFLVTLLIFTFAVHYVNAINSEDNKRLVNNSRLAVMGVSISRLDELLAAVSLAARDDDGQWLRTHEAYERELREITYEAVSLAADPKMRGLLSSALASRLEAGAFERRATVLQKSGDPAGLEGALASAKRKRVEFAERLAEFRTSLAGALDAERIHPGRSLAWMWGIFSACVVSLFVFWIAFGRAVRKYETHKIDAEDRLREKEAWLTSILETVTDGIIITRQDGTIDYANASAERLFELSRTELAQKGWKSLISNLSMLDGAPLDSSEPFYEKTLRTGEPEYGIEATTQRADGSKVFLSINTAPIVSSRRIVAGAVSTIRNITRSKNNNEKLRNFSQAVEQGAASVIITDRNGDIEYVNNGFSAITGYSPEDVIGENCRIMQSGHTPAGTYRNLWNSITAGDIWKGEILNRKKNGELFWEYAHVSPVRDEGGAIIHYIAIKEDITERKQAVEALRNSEARLAKSQSIAHLGTIHIDLSSGATYWSEELYRIFGMERAGADPSMELLLSVCHPDDAGLVGRHFRNLAELGGSANCEYRLVRQDGSVRYAQAQLETACDARGAAREISGVVLDITERKLAEQRLTQLNRALRVISACSKEIMQATNEADYLREICRHMVEIGEYRMAWIGFAEEDENRTVRPVAQAGFDNGYLGGIKVSWADNDHGRGPVGTAIRTMRTRLIRDIRSEPDFGPWRDMAAQRGYLSCIALPLVVEGRAIGALAVYSSREDAFDMEETGLLESLANDVGLGLETLRIRALRVIAQEALESSEERYRTLVESAADAIFMADVKTGIILDVNGKMVEMLGRPRHKIIGMHLTRIHPPEDIKRYEERYSSIASDPRPVCEDIHISRANGDRVPVEVTSNIVELGGRKIIQGIFRDLTERRKAEQELRESHNLLASISEAQSRFISSSAAKETFSKLMDLALQLTGSAAGFVGDVAFDERMKMWQIEPLAVANATWGGDTFAESGDLGPMLFEAIDARQAMSFNDCSIPSPKRGEPIRSFMAVPLLKGEKMLGVLGVVGREGGYGEAVIAKLSPFFSTCANIIDAYRNDIMRQRAENELRKSTELLEKVFSSTHTQIAYLDANLRFIRVNRAFAEAVNREPNDFVGKTYCAVCPNEEIEAMIRHVVAVREPITRYNQPYEGHGRQEPDVSYWDTDIRPVLDSAGGVNGVVISMLDVTERKKAEEEAKLRQRQLIQADKMKSLGVLISGVAHEINNPNSFIMINAPLLSSIWENAMPIFDRYYQDHGEFSLGGLPYDHARDAVPELLTGISNGSDRINHIVRKLKNFARIDASGYEQILDLNVISKSAITLMESFLNKTTNEFHIDMDESLPKVRGNSQEIEQVIINLISNACQSLRSRSEKIAIKTYYDKSMECVVVAIIDEGCGIASEHLNKITDPFFTTRRESGGTGLGLSVSYEIIRNHGGALEFFSEAGKGTRAEMRMPALGKMVKQS